MRIFKDITIGTPAKAWINQFECGYIAMQKFQEHYDGKSEG